MKRIALTALSALVTLPALATDYVPPREYGVAAVINFTLPDYDSPADLATNTDVAFAAGDVKYQCDEAAQADVEADAGAGTEALPTEEGGVAYAQALTAAQMQCKRIHLIYVDQDATKVWADWDLVVETYGYISAQHPTLGGQTAIRQAGPFTIEDYTADSPSTGLAEVDLPAGASGTTGFYGGWIMEVTGGTGIGQMRSIEKEPAYTGTVAVVKNFTTALAAGSSVVLHLADVPSQLDAAAVAIEVRDAPRAGAAADSFGEGVNLLLDARVQIVDSTATGGTTTTLTDTVGLASKTAEEIVNRYVVRDGGQACFASTFDPNTDTIGFACTFTDAWSNQGYQILPAGTQ